MFGNFCYITEINLCQNRGIYDIILVKLKSNNYSIQRKGKAPFSPLKDRLPTVAAFREITAAYETDDDILPPPEVLDRMREVH